MRKNAFTLVELLVVISIIGILAALVLVSFTGAQKQARDTQRKSDLKQFQALLESYANLNNGLYPATTTTVNSSILCGYLSASGCPADPKSPAFEYQYAANNSGGTCVTAGVACATQYVLRSQIENTSDTDYWVNCSSGKTGLTETATITNGACPL